MCQFMCYILVMHRGDVKSSCLIIRDQEELSPDSGVSADVAYGFGLFSFASVNIVH